ncbi:hypothetical protein [Chitinophaga nivalis]|uniref:HTTM-like domain-containing protein n=1 Tax=Chitinophaga nivalis TaxID=2991709 RepID=A0ABT3IP48_9BACT|nr:hypothetical protein [Chitinophaga nivalis]MCW3464592.1 hypothetical protein [Chitinophaga nivalis]MCW3485717.1 hypothetical protein [Chitinophaga nivalis]
MHTLFHHLTQTNTRSIYLSILRVALCLWLLKELTINWTSLELLYGTHSFLVAQNDILLTSIGVNIQYLREHYFVLIILYTTLVILYLLGIGRNLTAIFVFLLVELFQRMNNINLNGGDNLLKFMLLYLSFANTFQYLVLFNSHKVKKDPAVCNMLTNLAAYSIMFHLCLAYFISGISKAHADVWYNGVATYYTFSLERFKGTSYNEAIVSNGWIVLITTYATLLFELYFPVLIWVRKLRIPLIIVGICLHMGIYIFMMIYGFQIIFILTYGLFFTNEEYSKLFAFVKQRHPAIADFEMKYRRFLA